MKRRTRIDWSKHEVIEIKNENILIHHIKIPGTYTNSVRFINTCGILAVNGDFGNWIFCREFHPSADGYVSGGYWDEKLEISSQQESDKFDSETTIEKINEFKQSFNDAYGREMNEEEKEWVDDLLRSAYDETEYIYTAYREKPSTIDYESVPFGKKRHFWLNVVYDAFDEMCERLKIEKQKLEVSDTTGDAM